jgi:Meckel syndrome type 1 protein
MNMPLPPDHDDNLPGDAELAALYRKLPKSEPGPALDAAVLREAAQALGPVHPLEVVATRSAAPVHGNIAPISARTSRPRWLIALSSAATLVLVAGLAWHMRSMPAAESAMTRTAAPQSAAPVDTPSAPPSAVALAPTAPQAKAAPPTVMLSQVARAARPPVPRMQMQAGLVAAPSAMKPKKVAIDKSVPASSLAAITVSQSVSESIAASAQPSEPREYTSTDAARTLAPSPVAETSSPSANKVAAPGNESETAKAAPALMPAAAPAMPAAPEATEKDLRDTPAQELDKIRLLFAAHRDDQAKARLEAFRHKHPDQQLPTDLRARLPGRP